MYRSGFYCILFCHFSLCVLFRGSPHRGEDICLPVGHSASSWAAAISQASQWDFHNTPYHLLHSDSDGSSGVLALRGHFVNACVKLTENISLEVTANCASLQH